MDLKDVPTEELKAELFKREKTEVCSCQRLIPKHRQEPGKHQPWCDINPAYRPGDWN